MFPRIAPEQIIGTVGLNNIVRGCFHSCFLGYKLDQDFLNRGYMTEAVRAAVDYAFGPLALHRPPTSSSWDCSRVCRKGPPILTWTGPPPGLRP